MPHPILQALHLSALDAAAQLNMTAEALQQAAAELLGMPSWPGHDLALLQQLQERLRGAAQRTDQYMVCVCV